MPELSQSDIMKLNELLSWWRQFKLDRRRDEQRQPARVFGGQTKRLFFQAPVGGIPGRNNLTPGSATCNVVNLDASGDLQVTGDTESVLNMTVQAVCVNGSRFGMASWHLDAWWVDVEDCNDNAG